MSSISASIPHNDSNRQTQAFPSEIRIVCRKVASFVQNNIMIILANLAAWGVFISCSGLLGGYKAVSIPITIGMGAGFLWGAIIGIYVVAIFDRDNTYQNCNTFWGALNTILDKLNADGTRALVRTVAVSVIASAALVFPYAIGAFFGAIIGNQVTALIGYEIDCSSQATATIDMKPPESLIERVESLEKHVDSQAKATKSLIEHFESLEKRLETSYSTPQQV